MNGTPLRHRTPHRTYLMLVAALLTVPAHGTVRAQEGVALPAPAADPKSSDSRAQVAVLAGGCFWGVQGVFQHTRGIINAVSGYAGGEKRTATYDTVATGSTGHAEAVQITYDPKQISYAQILQVFFSVAHDPTQLNRQGPDVGSQYRSAIFPANDEQARVARAYIAQLDRARAFGAPIATKIEPGKTFYRAEPYHQDYMTRNPTQPYIVVNDLPKVANLKRIMPQVYRADPVLVSVAERR